MTAKHRNDANADAAKAGARADAKANPKEGYFGQFGGRFVAETLVAALDELRQAIETIAHGEAFRKELDELLRNYVGRPTPLTEAKRLARAIDPENKLFQAIYLKREDHRRRQPLSNRGRSVGKHRLIRRCA